jgi:hypothetical protein
LLAWLYVNRLTCNLYLNGRKFRDRVLPWVSKYGKNTKRSSGSFNLAYSFSSNSKSICDRLQCPTLHAKSINVRVAYLFILDDVNSYGRYRRKSMILTNRHLLLYTGTFS